ncbi:MAG: RNA polymerase sigma factor [Tenacibaculum sp.]
MSKKNVDLWKLINKGNMEAFSILYDENVDFLYLFGMQYCKDESFVKDCIHDLFLDIYKYRESISKVRNTKQYLLYSFKRKLFKHKSLDKYLDISSLSIASDENTAESAIIEKEEKNYRTLALSNALLNLSDKQRTCLFMRYNQGKEYKEIAQILNISVASVRTKIYRAVKFLRKELKK